MTRYLLALTLCACSDVQSSSILTSGLSAEFTATATGNGSTTAAAVLHVGDPTSLTYVTLTGTDQLSATSNSTTQVLSGSNLLGIETYSATLQGDSEGQSFTFDLKRTIDAGAPKSTATLPAAFTVATPATTTFSRANDSITLTWSPPSSDAMSWQVDGDCVQVSTQAVSGSDTGTLTIPKGTILASSSGSTQTCSVTLTILRSKTGVLDTGFGKGGSATGVQSRQVTIQSAP